MYIVMSPIEIRPRAASMAHQPYAAYSEAMLTIVKVKPHPSRRIVRLRSFSYSPS
jgi:hypothetical protein